MSTWLISGRQIGSNPTGVTKSFVCMVALVYTGDLKSSGFGHVGSNPTTDTNLSEGQNWLVTGLRDFVCRFDSYPSGQF